MFLFLATFKPYWSKRTKRNMNCRSSALAFCYSYFLTIIVSHNFFLLKNGVFFPFRIRISKTIFMAINIIQEAKKKMIQTILDKKIRLAHNNSWFPQFWATRSDQNSHSWHPCHMHNWPPLSTNLFAISTYMYYSILDISWYCQNYGCAFKLLDWLKITL